MGAVEEITGLKLNYYAMVNMHGFSKLVNAVGGVRINVQQRTAIGGIGSPIRGWIEAGEQKLTGDQALWYSRSRVQNDDFSRMGRQKCVMNAMLHQLSPQKVLFNVEKIASSSKALLTTNIPQERPRRLRRPGAQGQDAEGLDRLAGSPGDLHRQPRLQEGPQADRPRDRQGRGPVVDPRWHHEGQAVGAEGRQRRQRSPQGQPELGPRRCVLTGRTDLSSH